MSVLFVVLPLAILLAGAAVCAFFWATRQGQFDDLTTPPLRMLHDDEQGAAERKLQTQNSKSE